MCEYCELIFLTTLFYKLTVSKSGPEIIKSCESVKKKALHGSITKTKLKASMCFMSFIYMIYFIVFF